MSGATQRAEPLLPVVGGEAWSAAIERLGRRVPRPLPGAAPRHRRILFLTMVGASDLFAIREGLIAHALRLRGAEVIFLLCDGFPVCDARTFDNDDPDFCGRCYPKGADNLRAFGHTSHALSSFVEPQAARGLWQRAMDCPAEEVFRARYGGIELGSFVHASTLRYFRAGQFDHDDPAYLARARQDLAAALVMTEASRQAFRRLRPDKLFTNHPFYATWGPWAATARAIGLPFDVHHGGYRRNTLMCHHDSAATFHCDDLWKRYRDLPLGADQERRLDAYLATRETNGQDFNPYWERVDPDVAALLRRVGVSRRDWKRRVCAFTNVSWDAAQLEPRGAFADMFDWIDRLIEHFRARPDALLLIKAHPAETRWVESTPQRWRVGSRGDPSGLPDNVRFVPPDDNVGNFSLYRSIDLGLVNTSTVGLEMALAGVPVLTTGAGVHYEKPGIVRVARDAADYFAALEGVLDGASGFAPDVTLARRYAYTMFFRKSIPFELIDVLQWEARGLRIDALDELRPGRHAGLDVICDGILDDAPFDCEARSVPAPVEC